MNQILSVETPKKKNKKNNTGGPIEIEKIVRFFAVFMILFGICLIANSSYSMYKDTQIANKNAKPTIQVSNTSEKELTLKVTHNKALSKVTYSWNNEEPKGIQTNGKKEVEEIITRPNGTNRLKIYASDINGQEVNYEQTYTVEGNVDIQLSTEGSGLKISVVGQDDLSYMTYRWDEEEEQKVDINNTTIEQTIDIPKGQHTLTVIVVDKNNQTTTKVQEVKGVTKPEISIEIDTSEGEPKFFVKVTDEEGLKRLEFVIDEGTENEKRYKQENFEEGTKEFEYKFPIHDGENKILVRAYNTNDVSSEKGAKVNK